MSGAALLQVDGSQGEGGGQVLRTALALSLCTGTPFRIAKIRAGRDKPGLLRQHLTAVNAAATIGGAEVTGAALGSTALEFRPQVVAPGTYRFAVGSAGSATLVLQTVLPALGRADAPSTLTVEGGTHNPSAPPFDFLERAFLPLLRRIGPDVQLTLERAGFFPRGGGRFVAEVRPAVPPGPLDLRERGPVRSVRARAWLAGLPSHIADRELAALGRRLGDHPLATSTVERAPSEGPGNAVVIEIECAHVTEVFTAFGEKHLPAERVAAAVAREAEAYLEAEVPVGEYLADQLLLPLALGSGGVFRTLPLSSHAKTGINVIRQFLDVGIEVREAGEGAVDVEVSPAR